MTNYLEHNTNGEIMTVKSYSDFLTTKDFDFNEYFDDSLSFLENTMINFEYTIGKSAITVLNTLKLFDEASLPWKIQGYQTESYTATFNFYSDFDIW